MRACAPIDVFLAAAVCALFASVGLGGCVSRTGYPASWPSRTLQATDRCEPIRGSFENVGAWAMADERDERLLAGLLFPLGNGEPMSRHQDRRDVTHVTFDGIDETNVTVRGWVGTAARFERQLAAPELSCDEGRWVLRSTTWEVEGAVGAAARVSSRYEMAIAQDGSLVMEQRELGAGVIFMIVPIGTKASSWLRFPPAREI